MTKAEWGVKRVCPSCSTRFYDMRHQPITCPKCANVFDPELLVKKRRGRPPAAEAKPLPAPKELEDDLTLELEEELEPLSESDDVLEDTSDFGEDGEVVPIETPSDDD
jgi:uncharacterized protein (TIGR02300 family)